MPERNGIIEIRSPNEYYRHPTVSKVICQNLGLDLSDPSIFNSDDLALVKSEYLTVVNERIRDMKQGRKIAKSIKPYYLPEILSDLPLTEIFQSFWQKDAPGQEKLPIAERKPDRTLLVLDTEYFNNAFQSVILLDQQAVFRMMEPVYRTLSAEFNNFGIDHMIVASGRGYHFVTQVPYDSPVMDQLINIGRYIEPGILAQQAEIPPNSKRDRPVPPKAEMAHKGAARLAHFIVTRTIGKIRSQQEYQHSEFRIEMSDYPMYGVALDLTPMFRNINTGAIGIPACLYLKPRIKTSIYPPEVVNASRILTRLPRSINGHEFLDMKELIHARQHFNAALETLELTGGLIPNGSEGLSKLIELYNQSELKKFHDVLDNVQGDPPEIWEKTYRNYSAITQGDYWLETPLRSANDKMLDPFHLNTVLKKLFINWGGMEDLNVAGHVRTFLRSVYEDPRFNWGERFTRHEGAIQHANMWATIILGQFFEE